MAIQTTYGERMRAGTPGSIQGSDYNTKTGICETAAGIGFGLAVSQGAADQGVTLGGSAFVGISVRDVTLVDASVLDKYPETKNMAYLTRGMIYASPAVAVVAGDVVTYDTATGRLSNTGGTAIPGARWRDSAAGDGVARVELLANAGS